MKQQLQMNWHFAEPPSISVNSALFVILSADVRRRALKIRITDGRN